MNEWINTPKIKVVAYYDDMHKKKTLRHHQHHSQSQHSWLSKTSATIVSVSWSEVRYWIDVSQPFYLGRLSLNVHLSTLTDRQAINNAHPPIHPPYAVSSGLT